VMGMKQLPRCAVCYGVPPESEVASVRTGKCWKIIRLEGVWYAFVEVFS
jgi:hypothetical protein